jgi:hypothetical protein
MHLFWAVAILAMYALFSGLVILHARRVGRKRVASQREAVERYFALTKAECGPSHRGWRSRTPARPKARSHS